MVGRRVYASAAVAMRIPFCPWRERRSFVRLHGNYDIVLLVYQLYELSLCGIVLSVRSFFVKSPAWMEVQIAPFFDILLL